MSKLAQEETKDPIQDVEESAEGETQTETTQEASEEVKADSEKESKKDKKKDKGNKELEAAKAKIADLEDRNIRQIAEFQNFRNRTEKEKSQMFELGAKSVIEKVLPVVDNFERGLAAIPENEKDSAFAEGMSKIYKQLMTELDNLGVKPIEAKGKEFNPDFHNAVMQVENAELESGTVAEELLKGYTFHDTVVRHSMVSVVS